MKTVSGAYLAVILVTFAAQNFAESPPRPAAGPRPAGAEPALSAEIPHDVTISPGAKSLAEFQRDFDEFSWRSFVALNWPARPDGSPDPHRVIGAGGDNPTVWESYKEAYEVFLPDGSKPPAWGSPRPLPPACRDAAVGDVRVLRMTQKVATEVLDIHGQAFKTGPLVDQQSGRFVRYQVDMNREAFDYIVAHGLYSKAGQEKAGPAVFPAGDAATAVVGAIVLKAAWKVLGPDDHPERFHAIDAVVYDPPQDDPPVRESCRTVKMGLVGLHIAHKTKSSPQWVWSTFEQVDNVAVPAGRGLAPSFSDPGAGDRGVNQPPPRPWDPNRTWPKPERSRVRRVIPIDDATQALNTRWQARIKAVGPKSVWQYYELISTQWPTAPGASQTGNPAPQFLANATMETYIQGRVPNVSSSCILCHNNATTRDARPSDFTYLLERAR